MGSRAREIHHLLTALLQNKCRGCTCAWGTGGCRGSETTNFDFYLREGTPRGRRMGESPWFAGGVTQAMGSGAGLCRSTVWPASCWLGRWMGGGGMDVRGGTQGAAAISRCRQIPMATGGPALSTLHSLTPKVSCSAGAAAACGRRRVVGHPGSLTPAALGLCCMRHGGPVSASRGGPHSSFVVVLLRFRLAQTRDHFPLPQER